MKRALVWIAAMAISLSMTVACKKAETCENYVEKAASCRKKKDMDEAKLIKMKAFVMAFCVAQKADKDMGTFAKQRIACIHQKSCEDFRACTKKVREASRMVRYRVNLRKRAEKIKKLAEEKDYYKAQRQCTYSYAAKKLLASNDEKDKAAAKKFYDFCLTNIPKWLGQLRDKGTEKSYFSACRGKKFFEESGANPAQKQAIQSVCQDLRVVGIVNRIEKKASEYVSKKRMYWGCNQKNADKLAALKSESGKKLFAKYKALCYHQMGMAVLQAAKEKLMKRSRRSRRYCPYQAKSIVKAFRQWEDLAKPEHKETLEFFYKICKS